MKKKSKIIQTITAWYYPCRKKKPFEFGGQGYLWIGDEWIMRNKRELEKYYKHFTLQKCPCGKGCKPEKVKIIVMKEV